jgi:hypothetical protein
LALLYLIIHCRPRFFLSTLMRVICFARMTHGFLLNCRTVTFFWGGGHVPPVRPRPIRLCNYLYLNLKILLKRDHRTQKGHSTKLHWTGLDWFLIFCYNVWHLFDSRLPPPMVTIYNWSIFLWHFNLLNTDPYGKREPTSGGSLLFFLESVGWKWPTVELDFLIDTYISKGRDRLDAIRQRAIFQFLKVNKITNERKF